MIVESMKIQLSSYQTLALIPVASEQHGEGAVQAILKTSIDQPFIDSSVTALLTSTDQRKIAAVFGAEDLNERVANKLSAGIAVAGAFVGLIIGIMIGLLLSVGI